MVMELACCMVDGYPCRIGAGIGAEESCKTSSCRIAVLEEDYNVTASNGAFLK